MNQTKYNFIFNVDPAGQGRPRFSINQAYLKQQELISRNPRFKGKLKSVPHGFARDPQKSKNFKLTVGYIARSQFHAKLIDYPISVKLKFYRKVLKSSSKKEKEKMISGEIRPTKKPDIDNYVKGMLDALNKVLWQDDALITDLTVSKYFAEKPRIEMEIERVDAKRQK